MKQITEFDADSEGSDTENLSTRKQSNNLGKLTNKSLDISPLIETHLDEKRTMETSNFFRKQFYCLYISLFHSRFYFNFQMAMKKLNPI